jgi:hypothetical protein
VPVRIGFAQHRMRFLQEEVDKVVDVLPTLGVEKAILLNPPYPGTVKPDTALGFVMVMEDDRPFVRRPDFFYSHLTPSVAVDFFPYTPQEMEALEAGDSPLARAIRQGEVVYEQ